MRPLLLRATTYKGKIGAVAELDIIRIRKSEKSTLTLVTSERRFTVTLLSTVGPRSLSLLRRGGTPVNLPGPHHNTVNNCYVYMEE